MPNDTPVTEDGDEDTTSSSMTRWKYIGTILTGLMVASLPVVILGTALGTRRGDTQRCWNIRRTHR